MGRKRAEAQVEVQLWNHTASQKASRSSWRAGCKLRYRARGSTADLPQRCWGNVMQKSLHNAQQSRSRASSAPNNLVALTASSGSRSRGIAARPQAALHVNERAGKLRSCLSFLAGHLRLLAGLGNLLPRLLGHHPAHHVFRPVQRLARRFDGLVHGRHGLIAVLLGLRVRVAAGGHRGGGGAAGPRLVGSEDLAPNALHLPALLRACEGRVPATDRLRELHRLALTEPADVRLNRGVARQILELVARPCRLAVERAPPLHAL